MSQNTDVNMGLPRLSGKRSWSEANGDIGTIMSASKLLCTSPPHGICAEDVLQNSPPTSSRTADIGCKLEEKPLLTSDQEGYERLSESDDDNFMDDEEDKDSGFIDGNSIDNSSDDDDSKENSFSTSSSAAFTSFESHVSFVTESRLQTSNGEIINGTSPCSDTSAVTLTTDTMSSQSRMEPKMSVSESYLTSGSMSSNTVSLSTSDGTTFAESKILEIGTTTLASTLTGTVVTSSYQGSVSSLSYDLHPYPNMHPADPYFHRPGTPAWSCNFYDGSHPNTNKYMEISPNRTLPSQSIQCDENGKSYIELGSAAPFNNEYSNECNNFTTSQSTYQNPTYTSSFAGTNNFGPSSTYYNSRQPYGQNFAYNQNESYNYENDNICSYSYAGSYSNGLLRVNNGMLSRSHARCTSPYCDPTKNSPRSGCYNQQRLTIFNMSMYKLNRFNRFPEPNLHRSVLICNTLRNIEKEFETEGISMSAIIASHNQAYGGSQPHPPSNEPSNQNNGSSLENLPSISHSSSNSEGPLPSIHPPIAGVPLQLAPFCPSTTNQSLSTSSLSSALNSSSPLNCQSLPYSSVAENNVNLENKESLPILRPYIQSSISSLPTNIDSESSSWASRINVSSSDEKTEGINWCSVLSLSSQSDLDSVNNNDCSEWSSEEAIVLPYSTNSEDSNSSEKLPSLSADDVLKSFTETRRPEPTREVESLIKDMLGS